MKPKLEELAEASSLNSDFKAWYRDKIKAAPKGEAARDTLLRLAVEACAAKFSGECQDWLLKRAIDACQEA